MRGRDQGGGRVDLFCGHGSEAEMLAGSLKEKGDLYFLVKKKANGNADQGSSGNRQPPSHGKDRSTIPSVLRAVKKHRARCLSNAAHAGIKLFRPLVLIKNITFFSLIVYFFVLGAISKVYVPLTI